MWLKHLGSRRFWWSWHFSTAVSSSIRRGGLTKMRDFIPFPFPTISSQLRGSDGTAEGEDIGNIPDLCNYKWWAQPLVFVYHEVLSLSCQVSPIWSKETVLRILRQADGRVDNCMEKKMSSPFSRGLMECYTRWCELTLHDDKSELAIFIY